jgi:ketosteroid isomerase-like protein
MVNPELERMLNDWAIAWSSSDSGDPERILALFTDDCVFEDVTFGVVARGKEELRSFAKGAFAAVPDFKYGLKSSSGLAVADGLAWCLAVSGATVAGRARHAGWLGAG